MATALAKGAFGLPPMSWVGYRSPLWCQMAGRALRHARDGSCDACRRHIPLAAPRFSVLGSMLRVGVPFGVVQALDTLFFFTTTLMIGPAWRGSARAHQIVMNYGTITSSFCGIERRRGRAAASDSFVGGMHSPMRAGLDSSAIVMSFAMTTTAAACVALFPDFFLGLFLDSRARDPADRRWWRDRSRWCPSLVLMTASMWLRSPAARHR